MTVAPRAIASSTGMPAPALARLLAFLVVAASLVGCSAIPRPASTEVAEDRAAVLAELQAEVEAVAAGQAAADDAVDDVLDVVRAVDEAVARLERVDTFDATLDDYAAVHERVAAVSVDGLREPWFEVAGSIDAARATLASLRGRLDDPWEASYLDAQDALLVAVRDYAEAADRLSQLLIRHWPTYTEVDARIVDFASRRGNYRGAEEARDGLAVELDTVMEDLVVAETQIADYQSRRTEAGRAVNAASADAATVYENRPTDGIPAG